MTQRRPGRPTSTDTIELIGVRARGFHGVLPDERRDGQDFVVDVVMEVDLAPAGASDALEHTVSYAEVADDVVAVVEGPPRDLIEVVASDIAELTLRRPRVGAVEVTVHKPQAPVGHPFADVRVRIRRSRRSPVVIALGSNLGDSGTTLAEAAERITDVIEIESESPIYRTDPVGGPEQAEYLNSVVVGHTALTPWALLHELNRIEAEHGRTRDIRWGPRTLDLDIISYGAPGRPDEVVLDEPDLILPHPRAHERAFVLVPWLAADPDARLRVGEEVHRVSDLVSRCDTSGVRADGSPR
ncbi:2-amino-4-hydroxy-6-hydroxymethyldihydropteridine diphosphokinase [Marihabitans asiaticum]|uniref:Bifunctional folate synthesis protein n=1 Tax=Marihabitans asiaticum TaxID=415218 RepID=A0A560WDJ6_9MICO|nr:2-amino-4-hydroxy-6-hydroxymethyldihydropteridine diphosphokinase [Marihabitans asiaticum]TWD15676.1 dihydroneopterin aldolase/2-amino-4-hydroxy-6-hydroxymethyldihydropteridine diphosphokinase [Marihabitans asiaticum]